MPFINIDNGEPTINPEHKLRISLSERAALTMANDMDVFGIDKKTTFLNQVFSNYRDDAKASISLYLEHRKEELSQMLRGTELNSKDKISVIDHLLQAEQKELINQANQYFKLPKASKKENNYHINKNNFLYLTEDCNEEEYYNYQAGKYVRAVFEEYCSLPFIKRERIFRKDLYDIVEQACKEHRLLKVDAIRNNVKLIIYVYPYKIISDPLDTQSYLVCYTRLKDEDESSKRIASFNMARMNLPKMLKAKAVLSKGEIDEIHNRLATESPAYFLGNSTTIKVRLTEKGIASYNARLYSRPEKIDSLSSSNVYVFDCTPMQAYNYFFPFGDQCEILEPEFLRVRFQETMQKTLSLYNKKG